MSNGQKTTGNGQSAVGKQIYLRFVGTRGGEIFKTAGNGPWDVAMADGNRLWLVQDDRAELERDRRYLENERGVTGIVTEMCVPENGQLINWEPVILEPGDGGREAGGDAPLKRVELAAAVLFDLIDAMPDADAVDAIEVIKDRARVSMRARAGRREGGGPWISTK